MNFLPPRRIVMTADAVGGVWSYAVELARGFQPLGVELVLATMGSRPSAEQRAMLAGLDNVRLEMGEFALEWMESPWDGVARAGTWLQELERRYSPDVIHFNGYVHAAWPWRAPTVVVAHSCVLSWMHAVRGHDAAGLERYRDAVCRGLANATAVVAPTHAMLVSLRRHYGTLRAATVIQNGCRGQAFDAARAKEPFVLTAGRLWDEGKNLAALVTAATGLPWPVRAAGASCASGHPPFDAGEVELLGICSAPALADLYARAAIYAAPARYEPFGLAIVEAALSGCALVLGDIPSLRELWSDAAFFVPPNQPMRLREAILRLIHDSDRRAEMGRRALLRARTFTADGMVRQYATLYGQLVALAASPPALVCP